MKTIALTLMIAFPALTAWAQATTSETKDIIVARQRLRIGPDTSRYFTTITTTINELSTDRQATTAGAVERRVRRKVEYLTASGPINTATDVVIVPTLTTTINVVLPLCNAQLNGRTVTVENHATGTNSVRINTIFPNIWHSGSTRVVFSDRSGDCTCRFNAGVGTWFFKSN